jgi:hypothetical protein
VGDLKEINELNTSAIDGNQGLKEMEIHQTHMWQIILFSNNIVYIYFEFLEN